MFELIGPGTVTVMRLPLRLMDGVLLRPNPPESVGEPTRVALAGTDVRNCRSRMFWRVAPLPRSEDSFPGAGEIATANVSFWYTWVTAVVVTG